MHLPIYKVDEMLLTPFTILNQNFNEMDLIKDAMKNRRLAKEILHDD
tara:strand:+ start:316 stop:456 length:141 start_codon:yes stop_codon:yes gene_type:complete